MAIIHVCMRIILATQAALQDTGPIHLIVCALLYAHLAISRIKLNISVSLFVLMGILLMKSTDSVRLVVLWFLKNIDLVCQ
jgi:hypothetical protein